MVMDKILAENKKSVPFSDEKGTEHSQKADRRTRKPRLLFTTEKGLKPSVEYMHMTGVMCNNDYTELYFEYKDRVKFVLSGENFYPLQKALIDECLNEIIIGKTIVERDEEFTVNDYHIIDLRDKDNEAATLEKTLQQADSIMNKPTN